MIGMTEVACFAARTAGVEYVHIDVEPDELLQDFGIAFAASFGPPTYHHNRTALTPAQSGELLQESRHPITIQGSIGRRHIPNRWVLADRLPTCPQWRCGR